MVIPVLIEPTADGRFRARGGETRDDAVAMLREKIDEQLARGAEIVSLDVPAAPNPWLAMAGMFKDDPLFDEWQQAIAEYRDQMDQASR